jgi:ubiquinone/menaquinone biosynthesis C-methylase UbiE
MTKAYWDKSHLEKYSKADWAHKPSMFAEQAVTFFPKTGTLLEIGTGQGGDAEYFQSLGYEVTATDYSDEAIKSAQSKIKNVHFINFDTAKGFLFEDQSFDIVYSHMALHYFDAETTDKIFKDIYRILKPQGIFAMIVNTIDDPEKEEFNYIKIESDYYQDPKGIKKRYFSTGSMKEFTEELFQTLLLDAEGRTYKDLNPNLIRFIGRKK